MRADVSGPAWKAGASEAMEGDAFSFQLPAEASTRGVLVLDPDGRIKSVDSGICKLFGVQETELLGKDRVEAARDVLKMRFCDPARFESSCEWLCDHPGEIVDDVLELVHPEGHVLHRYSVPLFDEARQYVGRVEFYSDITRRRELESRVRQAYEELRTTQDQLVQSEKLRAVGEIAGGVAHDFNNTLGIILGNLQLLARDVQGEPALARLRAMETAALDAIETVRRIQEFTRIKPDEPLSSLDLGVLAAEVVDMLRPAWHESVQARGSKIEVVLHTTDRVFALGIGPEVREVLANILLNSIQAMPSGGKIEVSTGQSGDSTWIRVADTGVGMTEDVRKRIFDPFFTTRGVQGAGLGMSVAYGIVSRHNGAISVESEPGKGTVVTVLLPAASPGAAAPRVPQEEVAEAQPAKILVVDDEDMFAQVFVEMLTECGHAVCVARSGEEAIEQFRENPFDLVFTDLGMPEMSGWQVARTIKDMAPRTPVVLLTGWGKSVGEAELAESQVDMVLSKPVRLNELSSIVAKALGQRGGKAQPK